jgi:hypothetical protein
MLILPLPGVSFELRRCAQRLLQIPPSAVALSMSGAIFHWTGALNGPALPISGL